MIKRRIFYSFHYAEDSWRAATVRNIGVVEGNRPATDNHWEEIKRGGDAAIRRWIDKEMKYRSCTLVLVGSRTAGRRWINYEIQQSWDSGMGVAGIHIHGLRNQDGRMSPKGRNPFEDITVEYAPGFRHNLALIVRCFDPPGPRSRDRYAWIRNNLAKIAEDAIRIRQAW